MGTDGDSVGVVEKWTPPDPPGETVEELKTVQIALMECDGARDDVRAENWVGHVIATVLGLADYGPGTAGRAVVLARLKGWLDSGALVAVMRNDEKRMPRRFIVHGVLAS